jgi:ferric-dicitrate binding protein FerR (iron transport regulator)
MRWLAGISFPAADPAAGRGRSRKQGGAGAVLPSHCGIPGPSAPGILPGDEGDMALYRRFLPLLLLALPRSAGAAPDGRARVGEVSAVTGEAVARFAGAAPRILAPAGDLLLDDLVSTGPAARLVAQLEGGIEIRLGERASLRVDSLVLRGPRAGTALRIFEGPALLDRPPQASAGRGAASPIAMTLPWARIAVRGTRFFAGPLDGRYAVFVARGLVAVEAGGSTTLLAEGEGVDVAAPGAPPGAVVRWGQARIDRAMALVS